MKIICSATVNNFIERDKLRDTVRQLGVEPLAAKDMVYLEYEGDSSQIEKLVRLFEQYNRHSVTISDS